MFTKIIMPAAAIIYLIAVLAANLTATMFIPIPLGGGAEVWISVGTLIFGITFTQRDRMHRFGRPFVYRIIFLGAFLNLIMMLSYRFVWGMPLVEYFHGQQWQWMAESGEMLLDSGWRVFLASFIAMVAAESADTEIYHKLLQKRWMVRVIRSNAVSVPVDSIVFNLIAFVGSPLFPAVVLLKIIMGEIVSKYIVGLLYALFYPMKDADVTPPAADLPPPQS